MNERQCPTCGAAIDLNATECKYCGEPIAVQQPQPQQYQQPQYQQQQYQQTQYQQPMYAQPSVPSKSKIAAGILAILLGGLGIHKFYLGKIGMGILYILFCWTYIPAIIGVVEGIIYLTASDEKFYYKYDKH
ncbi:MAG TPA: hypothetical protein DIT16_05970 [Clostridium sp.]|nr:hypothetical protein [Clostridium sp.]